MNAVQRIFHRPFFIRLFNWEYWSFGAVYFLIYPIWIYFALRTRSFFFFNAANPSIKYGGFIAESKKDIISILPSNAHPKTVFFDLPINADIVILDLQRNNMQYPLIGKPNVGGRGRGVKALRDENDVREYVKKAFMDFHIQEYVSYKKEAGIFYYRYPGEKRGTVSGIVSKEFLSVTGNGKSTMRELLQKDKRAIMYLPAMERIHGEELTTILPAGETKIVSPYGNHSRGSKFLDDSHLIDEALTDAVDKICQQIPGFHYGRLDIRYESCDLLKQGKNFSIIEVNGAGSEPTHMYDPKHSLFYAWKEIVRHWFILYRVSKKNHQLGHPYLSLRQGMQMFKEGKQFDQMLADMPE